MKISEKFRSGRVRTLVASMGGVVRSVRNWFSQRDVADRSPHGVVGLAAFAGVSAAILSFVFVEILLSRFALMGTTEGLLFVLSARMHFVYDIYKLYPFLIVVFTIYVLGGVVYGLTLLFPVSQRLSEYSIELEPESVGRDVVYLIGVLVLFGGEILMSAGGPMFGMVVSFYSRFFDTAREWASTAGVALGLSSASLQVSAHVVDAFGIILTMLVFFRLFTAAIRVGNITRLYGIGGLIERTRITTADLVPYLNLFEASFRIYMKFVIYNLLIIGMFGALVAVPTVIHIIQHLVEIVLSI